jgi:Domain of Unknown Function (DUF748)
MSTRSRVLVWLLALAGTALAVAVLVALLSAPLARHLTRQALSSLKGVHGGFLSARIDPLALTYTVENLMLVADDARPVGPPLLTVRSLQVHLRGRDLLRGKLTVSAVITKGKLAARLTKGGPSSTPDPGAEIGQLPPLRLSRVELRDCEVLLTDATVTPSATLWVHEITADLEDLATRRGLSSAPAAMFRFHGLVQRSGKLTASGTLDPLASVPTFAGEIKLTDLQLSEQYALIAPRTGLQSSAGGNALKTVEAGLANAKIESIPERFAAERPATFDVPWAGLGTLWDEMVNRAHDSLLAAMDSAVPVKAPAPVSTPPRKRLVR